VVRSQSVSFALGIMPYISASIVVQLKGMLFLIAKLQSDESGRKRLIRLHVG
jgi:preprotein translocase subunit SecY